MLPARFVVRPLSVIVLLQFSPFWRGRVKTIEWGDKPYAPYDVGCVVREDNSCRPFPNTAYMGQLQVSILARS
jgi:hypothetical protein